MFGLKKLYWAARGARNETLRLAVTKAVAHRDIAAYMASHEVRCLEIGCGPHAHEGWLNTDYRPYGGKVVFLDASHPFPIGDASIDYIHTEHMIEHVSYDGARTMMSECLRVLRLNGTIRIATPDLLFLTRMHSRQKSDLDRKYIDWATREFVNWAPTAHETYIINNFVRDWGHAFIHDESTLTGLLATTGFSDIHRVRVNESSHPLLRNLENRDRMPEGFYELETMIFEAAKPR